MSRSSEQQPNYADEASAAFFFSEGDARQGNGLSKGDRVSDRPAKEKPRARPERANHSA